MPPEYLEEVEQALRRPLGNAALADAAVVLDLETARRRVGCEPLKPAIRGFCGRVRRQLADAAKRRADA